MRVGCRGWIGWMGKKGVDRGAGIEARARTGAGESLLRWEFRSQSSRSALSIYLMLD